MEVFKEQLMAKKLADEKEFSQSIENIANAAMPKGIARAYDEKVLAESAIAMILQYYKIEEKEIDIPDNVVSLTEKVEYMAKIYDLLYRKAELRKGFYKDSIGPMIAIMKESGTLVALMPKSFKGYYYIDFKTGEKVDITAKNETLFEDNVLCFYRALPNKPLNVFNLIKFVLKDLKSVDIIFIVGITAIIAGIQVLQYITTSLFFNDIIVYSEKVSLFCAMTIFLVCYLFSSFLFSIYKELMSGKITVHMELSLEAAIYGRLLNLPNSFFKKYTSGELAKRYANIQTLSSVFITAVVSTGLPLIMTIWQAYQASKWNKIYFTPIVLIQLTAIAVIAIVIYLFSKNKQKSMDYASKNEGLLQGIISGVQKIKLAGIEKRMFSIWANDYKKIVKVEYNPSFIVKIYMAICLFLTLFGNFIFLKISLINKVPAGEVYAIISLFATMSASLMAMANSLPVIATLSPVLDMLNPILNEVPEETENKEVIKKLNGDIGFSNVSFRYSKDAPYVVDNMSFHIKPGEYVGIVGSTGCGKSTLLKLLLGFEKAEKGYIYYDKKNIDKIELKSLRNNIGTVMQDDKLFTGDIYSNISMTNTKLTLDEAWELAEIVSIADDIKAMPMEMMTLISDGGGGISGGQRQRLLIARALASKPKILMFDEATCALDNVTQKNVSDAIDKLNCTRIVIAHRLSTIKNCDRILALDKGKIIEEGTYEELIAKKGFFAELVERQRVDVDVD